MSLLSKFDGGSMDCKNIHGMNYIKIILTHSNFCWKRKVA